MEFEAGGISPETTILFLFQKRKRCVEKESMEIEAAVFGVVVDVLAVEAEAVAVRSEAQTDLVLR